MIQQITIPENLNKETIAQLTNSLVQKVDDGDENPLHTIVRLRFMKKVIEDAEEKIKGFAVQEAAKLDKKGDVVLGVNVRHTEGRRTFDYSNDKEWNDLKEKMKNREEMLKGLTKPMADPDSGEIIEPPLVKYSAETVTVTFK